LPPAARATPEQRAEWGRRGGVIAAERQRVRRAAAAEAVKLTTVDDMRGFLEKVAGELAVATLDESRKAQAAAAIVRALSELDNFREIVRERDALRSEVALLRAVNNGPARYETTLTRPAETGSSPVAPNTEAAGTTEVSR
jgi:hypothetical protein